MESDILKKKIIFKIIFLIVLALLFCILFVIPPKDTKLLDKNLNIENYHRLLYNNCINKFFKLVEKQEFDKAYDMLTDNCKSEVFSDNKESFSSTMKSKYIDNSKCLKRYQYSFIKEFVDKDDKKNSIINCIMYCKINDKNSNILMGDLGTDDFLLPKELTVYVAENKPFDYKLYLVLD